MRPHGSQAKLQQRRRQAVVLRQHGCGPSEIVRRLKTTPQSLCRWVRAYRKRGGPCCQAGAGSAVQAEQPAEARPGKVSAERSLGLWLRDRSLDVPSYCHFDRAALRSPLSRRSHPKVDGLAGFVPLRNLTTEPLSGTKRQSGGLTDQGVGRSHE